MSQRTLTVAAVALAATLLSTLPAAARPAAPRAVQAAPAGVLHDWNARALSWLVALWGGGRERTATARTSSVAPPPDAGAAVLSIRPTPRPAGSGIDPDGFF